MPAKSKAEKLPQVDKLLHHQLLLEEQKLIRRELLTILVRQQLSEIREALQAGGEIPGIDSIALMIVNKSQALRKMSLKRVVNATGVILNTNLGRAPLAKSAIEQLSQIAQGYCNLEIELATGNRGRRQGKLQELLQLLTGCQAALVVNNNAAAVLLAVNTFSKDKQTIVSRGELIEIGGSFRLPEVIVAAGGVLKEVGTTNRTRLKDYHAAIGSDTGLLLKCHRSNFEITGFTEETTLKELVDLSSRMKIPLLEDLGSGALLAAGESIAAQQTLVSKYIEAGCDLIAFSGDKLLGGAQAGIILGKRKLIERLHDNPLYRALRVDKLQLAALEATLIDLLSPAASELLPVLFMTCLSESDLKQRAETFARNANKILHSISCQVVATQSTMGGGSLPGQTLSSFGIAIHSDVSAHKLSQYLRAMPIPIISLISNGQTVLDFRTVSQEDEALILQSLEQIDTKQIKGI